MSKYKGDGALEQINPERLTLGCVVRMPYGSGEVPAFGDSVIIGIHVSYSSKRTSKERCDKRHYETLAQALTQAQSGDFVVVSLARPYVYANNPFVSTPGWLVGCEKYEVMGDRIIDTHKVVVQSTGEYATYNIKPALHSWEVVVGNIGSVYRDLSESAARATYKVYVENSKWQGGRASGESVTLFCDGEIVEEHVGTVEG